MIMYDFQKYTLPCKDFIINALQCEAITTGKGTIAVYIRPMKDEKGGIIKRVYRNGDYQLTLEFHINDRMDYSALKDIVGIADSALKLKKFGVKEVS